MVQKTSGIWVENSWNMDESGIAVGFCTNSVRLGDALKKKTLVQLPKNREWVSIVELVLALGRLI